MRGLETARYCSSMVESSSFPIDKPAFLRSCAFASHYRTPKAASSTIKMFFFDET